jgi:hypothetical protein
MGNVDAYYVSFVSFTQLWREDDVALVGVYPKLATHLEWRVPP